MSELLDQVKALREMHDAARLALEDVSVALDDINVTIDAIERAAEAEAKP